VLRRGEWRMGGGGRLGQYPKYRVANNAFPNFAALEAEAATAKPLDRYFMGPSVQFGLRY
jgi:hypothetical protein